MQINHNNFGESLDRFYATGSANKSSDFMAQIKKLDDKEKSLKTELERIQNAKVDLMIEHTGADAFENASSGAAK